MTNDHSEYILKIDEMDCADEVALLKKGLRSLVNEDDLAFDLVNRKLIIKWDKQKPDLMKILDQINALGLHAEVWGTENRKGTSRNTKLALVIASGTAIGVGLIAGHSEFSTFAIFSYLVAIVLGGRYIVPKAFIALKNVHPDMNLLMTLAVAGAMILGEYLEAATVTFLFAISLLLETWSKERARHAIESLLELVPDSIRIIEEGNEMIVPAQNAAIGTMYFVKPGEKISLDGIVVRGNSEVNQAPITGESIPVDKKESDPVFAGTINGNGFLEIQATATSDQSTLSKMIRLVDKARLRRSTAEKWVDKFSRVYTPVVIALALLTQLIPPIFFSGDWLEWFYKALVLLVIACPCALVISTPVSIVSALTAASINGILIKSGEFIEIPASLKAIAFDKTGTLTTGHFRVDKVIALEGFSEQQVLEIAGTLAANSDHPISRAVFHYATSQHSQVSNLDEFRFIPGKGSEGLIDRINYWIGSHHFLKEKGQETTGLAHRINELKDAGLSMVVVGNSQDAIGIITLSDTLKPSAHEVIQSILKLGIHPLMLTGDNPGSAAKVAQFAGIEEYYSAMLPEEKVQKIESLVEKMGAVAMVGDGINDAPAMARATIGIAMGAAGSDTAIETADIALMSDDLTKIPWLISHSKRTMRIIKQNIGFSISSKFIFMVLTFFGYSSLWTAILADTGVSLLVVFNGLRLLRK